MPDIKPASVPDPMPASVNDPTNAPRTAAASPNPPQPQPLALARAETGGGGNMLAIILIAVVVVLIAVGALFYFSEKTAVATGEVTHVAVYPIHRVSNAALEAEPRAAKVENTFDQVIVIAQLRLTNKSKIPIYLSDISAVAVLPAEEDRSFAANPTNYDRVFLAYPELAAMKQHPLLRDTTIPPGETVEGQLLFNYPITQDQWNARKSLDLTITFVHQPDLVLTAPQ